MSDIAQYIPMLVTAIFTEAFAVGFLLGLVLFLIGLALLGMAIYTRATGYRVQGLVAGGVIRSREKHKRIDGQDFVRMKHSVYPLFEYVDRSGESKRMLGSEGGSSVLAYTTGQAVDLLVCPANGYDDVYDANSRSLFYFSGAMIGIGLLLMWQVGSLMSALGAGLFSLLVGVGALVLRIIFSRQKPKKKDRADPGSHKAFSEADVLPIDELAERYAALKNQDDVHHSNSS